jgi:hypothetical protein
MYNNGNSSKNVTGASIVDGTLESADYADNALSGSKIQGGSLHCDSLTSSGDIQVGNGDYLRLYSGGNNWLKYNAWQVSSGSGLSLISMNAGASITMNTESEERLRIDSAGNTQPGADDSYDLGTASKRWNDIYATNGTIQTSDERQKDDITPTELGLAFINNLNPVSYKWKDYTAILDIEAIDEVLDEDGTVIIEAKEATTKNVEHIFTRTHQGLIAQQVEGVLAGKDFAGLIYNEESDRYGLRYTEFVAPLIKAVQELTARIEQLENN